MISLRRLSRDTFRVVLLLRAGRDTIVSNAPDTVPFHRYDNDIRVPDGGTCAGPGRRFFFSFANSKVALGLRVSAEDDVRTTAPRACIIRTRVPSTQTITTIVAAAAAAVTNAILAANRLSRQRTPTKSLAPACTDFSSDSAGRTNATGPASEWTFSESILQCMSYKVVAAIRLLFNFIRTRNNNNKFE